MFQKIVMILMILSLVGCSAVESEEQQKVKNENHLKGV